MQPLLAFKTEGKHNKRGNKLAGRALIPERVGIEHRPTVVNEKRIGDYEVDTIIGAGKSSAILTIVDRKVNLTLLLLLPDKSRTHSRTESLKSSMHSITADNGKEFTRHQQVSHYLDADFFFANPYCSWERGFNEIPTVLTVLPQKKCFDKITQQDVKKVQYLLNTRPRKALNDKTPLEVFFAEHDHKLNVVLRC